MKIRGYEITLRSLWPTKAVTPRRAEKKRAVAASLAASPRPQIETSPAKYFEGLLTTLSATSPQDLVGFYSITASHLIREGKIEQALKIIDAKVYRPDKKAGPMLEAIVALAEIGTEESVEQALNLIEKKAPVKIKVQAMLLAMPLLAETANATATPKTIFARAEKVIRESILGNRDQAICLASLAHYQNSTELYETAQAVVNRAPHSSLAREKDLLMLETLWEEGGVLEIDKKAPPAKEEALMAQVKQGLESGQLSRENLIEHLGQFINSRELRETLITSENLGLLVFLHDYLRDIDFPIKTNSLAKLLATIVEEYDPSQKELYNLVSHLSVHQALEFFAQEPNLDLLTNLPTQPTRTNTSLATVYAELGKLLSDGSEPIVVPPLPILTKPGDAIEFETLYQAFITKFQGRKTEEPTKHTSDHTHLRHHLETDDSGFDLSFFGSFIRTFTFELVRKKGVRVKQINVPQYQKALGQKCPDLSGITLVSREGIELKF